MKKIFYFALAAFTTMFVSCVDENKPSNGDENGNSIVGTWNLQHDDDFETLDLTAGNNYNLYYSAFYKEDGSYTFENNTLTLTPSKAWTRDYIRDDVHGGPILDENGNFQFTEWEETEPWFTTRSNQVTFLYSGDVMLVKTIDEHSGEPEEVWAPYVKDNATHVSNINDIQGKWYWLMDVGEEFSVPRVIVNVNGNDGDVIITPWGERYKGTVRYEKGVLYMDNPTFYTTRYEDGEGGWEHMNGADPENSDWRIPDGSGNYGQPAFGMISMGFVADGDVAYGGIANLLAKFVKQ